ncbi:MAG: dockerin type I domain-containing protein, partial [bacterium]|nr:dockerin type I domain-containing protein [bacterium]
MRQRRETNAMGVPKLARSSPGRIAPRGGCRLRLELLESRRLLAGLQVSVYIDQDGSRSFDGAFDLVAANRLVYLDHDGNGVLSTGEPVQVTDRQGRAEFEGLQAGTYRVGLLANPSSQRQSNSIQVASRAKQIATTPAEWVLGNQRLSDVWVVDEFGLASREVLSADSQGPTTVVLGGPVLDALAPRRDASTLASNPWVQDNYLLVVREAATNESKLLAFDVATGKVTDVSVQGIPAGGQLRQVLHSQHTTIALVERSGELLVTDLFWDGQSAVLSAELATSVSGVAANESVSHFAVIEASDNSGSRVVVHDIARGAQADFDFSAKVTSIQFSADGQFLFAALGSGGIGVLQVGEQSLVQKAILADAVGPVSVNAVDGRIVARSANQPGKVVVWEAASWLPVGTTTLPAALGGGSVYLQTDVFGDRALVAHSSGLYEIDLAISQPLRVDLADGESAEVMLGLRETGDNRPPSVADGFVAELSEDGSLELDLGSADFATDADGDQLWLELSSAPKHGSFSRVSGDIWRYTPRSNFHGMDVASLRVHDGVAVSELILQWEVEPVNDPPLAIHLQLPPIAENPTPGTIVGTISVVDPDVDAEYRITTPDPRFSIIGGQIYFVEGELDFDVEPNVSLQVLATDVENSDYTISVESTLALTDVNEPPTGIELQLYGEGIEEHVPGAAVGLVRVLDPDQDAEYEVEVADERFEVVDGELRLLPDQELDFETAGEVNLGLTAKEVGGQGQTVSQAVTVAVRNRNEAPLSIHLFGSSVEGGVAGALIGQLEVVDPDGDVYVFSPHDHRFEVHGNVLKLKQDQSLDPTSGTIHITVSARAASGDHISGSFPVLVREMHPPYQNPINPYDVNGDGIMSPLDVLEVINDINQGGGGPLPPTRDGGGGSGEHPYMPDVNGDGQLTPIDVLHLINELNKQNPFGEGEGEQDIRY